MDCLKHFPRWSSHRMILSESNKSPMSGGATRARPGAPNGMYPTIHACIDWCDCFANSAALSKLVHPVPWMFGHLLGQVTFVHAPAPGSHHWQGGFISKHSSGCALVNFTATGEFIKPEFGLTFGFAKCRAGENLKRRPLQARSGRICSDQE